MMEEEEDEKEEEEKEEDDDEGWEKKKRTDAGKLKWKVNVKAKTVQNVHVMDRPKNLSMKRK